MFIKINTADATPVYAQMMQQIKYTIASGTLKPGDRLPTVRELATQLTINPNTVLKVYGELEHEGIVTAHKGKGIFVAEGARVLNQQDREKLLTDRCRSLATECIHLGVSPSRAQELLEKEYHKLKDSSNSSKSDSNNL